MGFDAPSGQSAADPEGTGPVVALLSCTPHPQWVAVFSRAFDSAGATLGIADIRIEDDAIELFGSHADLRRLSRDLHERVDLQ